MRKKKEPKAAEKVVNPLTDEENFEHLDDLLEEEEEVPTEDENEFSEDDPWDSQIRKNQKKQGERKYSLWA